MSFEPGFEAVQGWCLGEVLGEPVISRWCEDGKGSHAIGGSIVLWDFEGELGRGAHCPTWYMLFWEGSDVGRGKTVE